MMGDTAILVGVLFAAGTYLILQEKFSRILFGFILFSNAANLFVLSMAGNPDGKGAPVVLGGGAAAGRPVAAGSGPHGDRDRFWCDRLLGDVALLDFPRSGHDAHAGVV